MGKPRTPDLLPWWSVLPIGMMLILAVKAGREHPNIVTGCLAVAVLLTAEVADRWQGTRRMAGASIAAILGLYSLAATVHISGRWWWLWAGLCVLLLPWTAWRVGGGAGTRTREVDKIKASLPNVMRASSPKFKDGTRVVKLGQVDANKFGHVQARYTVRDPGFNGPGYAALVAHDLQVPAGLVTDVDLSKTVAQGQHVLTVRAFAPFANDAPDFPEPDTWKGREPLGWDANGEVVWLSPLASDAQGELVGGTTGSGKSNYIRLRALTKRAAGWEVWAVDGSGGSLGLGPYCAEYHEDDRAAMPMIDKAYTEMVRRRSLVKPGGIYDGPGILVVIDESDSVMSNNGAALAHAVKELAQQGRKTKINLILGLQSAYVGSVGGKEGGKVLNNLPMRVAFRCSSELQGRQILGESKPGYRPDEIARTNRGECVIKGMPQSDWEVVRTWEVVGIPDTSVTRDADVRSMQGEQPVTPPGVTAPCDATDLRIVEALDGEQPRSIRDLASELDCHPESARRALRRLANGGRAVDTGRGWVKAS